MQDKDFFSGYICDETDLEILKVIEQNAKLNFKEIAVQIGLTTTPVYERIKRMERAGIILGYFTRVEPKVLNRQLKVHCHISLSAHHHDAIHSFEESLQKHEEIQEAFHIAGAMDYVLTIAVKDMEAYQRFLKQTLTSIPYIAHVQSNFVMSIVKS